MPQPRGQGVDGQEAREAGPNARADLDPALRVDVEDGEGVRAPVVLAKEAARTAAEAGLADIGDPVPRAGIVGVVVSGQRKDNAARAEELRKRRVADDLGLAPYRRRARAAGD